MLKRVISVLLILCILSVSVFANEPYETPEEIDQWLQTYVPLEVNVSSEGLTKLPAKSMILLEQYTGEILFEQDADVQMPPASMTKIMTLLLVMEAIAQNKITLQDMVTCSEHASSMGGSQIWFEPGEQMTVHDLIKATAVSSANDAAVALAEYVAGSEEAFVDLMNQKAKELGMTNTTFQNATGLDAEGHVSTARDIAIASCYLLSHSNISDYSTIWMDSLRDGKTQLVNTNKLVRFYDGITGLKTGYTEQAGSCLSASATRNGLSVVAVVMGSATSDERFQAARGLLNYAFANYEAIIPDRIEDQLSPVKVILGTQSEVEVQYAAPAALVLPKGAKEKITQQVELATEIKAPVEQGQTIGTVKILLEEEVIAEYPLQAAQTVEKMSMSKAFQRVLQSLLANC